MWYAEVPLMVDELLGRLQILECWMKLKAETQVVCKDGLYRDLSLLQLNSASLILV